MPVQEALMVSTNQYGLPRDIPEHVKRSVRQRDGFGCVFCGLAIYQYEHVDPPFAEARTHDASAITLLCGSCHDKVSRKFTSKDSVKAAMANPKCKQEGFAHQIFDFGVKWPWITLASVRLENSVIALRICGRPMMWIRPPEAPGTPCRLSADFLDAFDKPRMLIRDNEWKVSSGNWDVTAEGGVIKVSEGLTKICLQISLQPPAGIIFDRLDFRYRGWRVFAETNGSLAFQRPSGTQFFLSRFAIRSGCPLVVGDSETEIDFPGLLKFR
jgi:hypothetical protein